MKESEQLFVIKKSSGPGETSIRKKDGAVIVKYNPLIDVPMSTLGHELKHAYDYDKGKLSYPKTGNNKGSLYDLNDEVRGFKRQMALGVSFGKDKNGNRRSLNIITADKVKNQTDSYGQKIYESLPEEDLDVNNVPKEKLVNEWYQDQK